jgi:hypothetical protein
VDTSWPAIRILTARSGGLWRNHEWLTEIVMAVVYNHLGVVGLKLWKFTCVAATIVLMATWMAETGASPAIQLNTLALAVLAMIPQNQFRPQIFTFMLLAASLALLSRDNYRGRAPLWLMIPILALWGNLHGGFIIGIATLLVYTSVVGLQDLAAGRAARRALRLGLITLAGNAGNFDLILWNRRMVGGAQRIERLCGAADYRRLAATSADDCVRLADTSGEVVFFLFGLLVMLAFAITVVREPRGGDLPLVAIAVMLSVAAFTAVRPAACDDRVRRTTRVSCRADRHATTASGRY